MYKERLTKILGFVKRFYDRSVYDIILFIIVALLILLSFAIGFITAKYQNKIPIQIEQSKQ
ncbi:MAG: hypothetical protein A2358_00255 [Candidatus Staskawiczbacteria bacterium RIFOXYB1_FULL_37_44]|uniref:Uncharacterized protein n=1 Tax=Candidatus Staskawiczbacteria bacterium RIFOXYB1_FULL_37_44 TaxID=1802223 RepID=A0A1G2IX04_9BACT|nr:MAG: hypothetical protein A2358_00255 [Candidatus Staskawiczbacteria bacterium RIFOXYB1_FULL_37_44]OGZ83690.1 MAG: hypothetical protein A2416_03755 [Candidatus Staskawiczbacteria bacterium RIFOXYC1_FULL_37_52]OGZ87199.1 MAG: hypothetical protein A2444_02495 [Candidatus Staskawiczbacteria bacterium RIFOXYC2_FULL_37_19]OGZ90214.1 MAG: hypothetical protein A2581_02285 [Candidatus Staskawiczbacteria bacterium RIFOXYD1_FULL_37_110]